MTDELIERLAPGAGFIVGTVSADGEPRASRAWAGTHLSTPEPRVRLVMSADDAGVVANLASGLVALTGADVRTLRAVQVKGRVLCVEEATADDLDEMSRQSELFFQAVHDTDGTDVRLLQRLLPAHVLAVELSVEELYDQSPGPRAGEALVAQRDVVRHRSTSLPTDAIDAAIARAALTPGTEAPLALVERCFSGAIPAVMATASPEGVPNVTYLTRAHRVDDERIAISNQFMSKTARNLAMNPRASLLLIDPGPHDEYRLLLTYERTERRGHVFDRLRADVDAVAALTGMQDVFRLRAADIFRVLDIVRVVPSPAAPEPPVDHAPPASVQLDGLGELAARLARCSDLDVLVDVALDGLDRLLGYHHVHLLLVDEQASRLYTIASRGFDAESIGAEVPMGDGLIGSAAARCEVRRVGNLHQMSKYSRSIRREYEESGASAPGREIVMPGLARADSRLVVPAIALGQLVGVLVVDSARPAAFDRRDELVLGVVAAQLAALIEHMREEARGEPDDVTVPSAARAVERETRHEVTSSDVAGAGAVEPVALRFFASDGSAFLGNDYLIKGVAGRILWALARQHVDEGRVDFTNKELRLDPSLEMPGFKDNLESRLILLKRRLDERGAPLRIEKTGRGRFRLHVDRPLRLVAAE